MIQNLKEDHFIQMTKSLVIQSSFSTCNVKNKKCRGWELNSDEFVRDKKNKIFEYKRSWLKIFNVKLFCYLILIIWPNS